MLSEAAFFCTREMRIRASLDPMEELKNPEKNKVSLNFMHFTTSEILNSVVVGHPAEKAQENVAIQLRVLYVH